MGHAIITTAHVLRCLSCGHVKRVAPVRGGRSMGPWNDEDCCSDTMRDWRIETVVRVWPRIAAEEIYLAGSFEHDELRGPEAWRLNPDLYSDSVLIGQTGTVVTVPGAGRARV